MNPVVVLFPVGDDPPKATLYFGVDALTVLRQMATGSVDMVVTTPPGWGQPNQEPSQRWPTVTFEPLFGTSHSTPPQTVSLGFEQHPLDYVGHLLLVFRELRRVLSSDGLVFLTCGDLTSDRSRQVPKLKSWDLVGLPWVLAFALRTDGWQLREDFAGKSPRGYSFLLAHPDRDGEFESPDLPGPAEMILAGTRDRAMVLDPFSGSGKTGSVALRLGRNFTGILSDTEARVLGYSPPLVEGEDPVLEMFGEEPHVRA